jgi:branched-chain amino acid transport system permease protein
MIETGMGGRGRLSTRAKQRALGYGQALVMLLAAAAFLAAPWLLSSYRTFQLTQMLIYSIAILGLNLASGYGGQISIGHGAFYGLGAYLTAILVADHAVPDLLTLPVSFLLCFGVGFLFGLSASRLQGMHLALASFALAVALPQLLKSRYLAPWTGGVQGIALPGPEPLFGLPISPHRWLYLVTLLIAILLIAVASNLVRGRFGRAVIAIRDQPIAAEAMGIHAGLYKAITFGISAAYAGIAGSLGAMLVQFISPDSFTVFLSISLVVGLVIGGPASIFGALFGAAFITFIPNLADDWSKAAPWAIYGVLLIACLHLMPNGLAGSLGQAGRSVRRLFGAASGRIAG